jgi:hypothetical protein
MRIEKMLMLYLRIVIVGVLFCGSAFAKDVEEKFDDGTVHLRYAVDAKDRKSGEYQEFFQSGKLRIRGTYTADKKTGTWTTFNEAGKAIEIASYRNDELDGPYQWNFPSGQAEMRTSYQQGSIAGQVSTYAEHGGPVFSLSYPNSWDSVLKAWKTLNPTDRAEPKMLEQPKCEKPYSAGKMSPDSQQAALKYLMLYRFFSGVTTAGMGIDPVYVDRAQHGAVLLRELGHLSHTPKQPADMDSDFFKTAYAGTSSSNISQGRHTLFDSIDDYMDDSDTGNVQRVGHRQWILMPSMLKTGFGYADGFSTLFTFDGMNRSDMNWTYIAYPGPGFYPHPLLRDDAAWSISLNNQKCKAPTADTLSITISTLDEHYAVTDTATAEIVAIPQSPNSAWPCIVFRPKIKQPGIGKYVVQVTGIRTTTGAAAPLEYLVDVREMPAADAKR